MIMITAESFPLNPEKNNYDEAHTSFLFGSEHFANLDRFSPEPKNVGHRFD